MPVTTVGDFGRLIGARMRADHESLARRWLVRLNELLPVSANEVFPSQALLDHIPSLIQEIADYLEDTDADELPPTRSWWTRRASWASCATSSGRRCTSCCVNTGCS